MTTRCLTTATSPRVLRESSRTFFGRKSRRGNATGPVTVRVNVASLKLADGDEV